MDKRYGLTECCINNLGYLFLQLLQKNFDSAKLLHRGDELGLHECVIPSFIDKLEEIIHENSSTGNAELKILHDEIVHEIKEGSYLDLSINHYFARIEQELEGRDTVAEFFKNCFKEASVEFEGTLTTQQALAIKCAYADLLGVIQCLVDGKGTPDGIDVDAIGLTIDKLKSVFPNILENDYNKNA